MGKFSLIKLLTTACLFLAGFMTSPAFAWPEVDTMNMCNQPVKVVRAYKGGAKSWANRDQYTNSQKQRLYAANCPNVRQASSSYSSQNNYKAAAASSSASETCIDCYKKGFKDGYRASKNRVAKKVNSSKSIQRRSTGGYRSHEEEVEDCKRVDRANYANRSKVVYGR